MTRKPVELGTARLQPDEVKDETRLDQASPLEDTVAPPPPEIPLSPEQMEGLRTRIIDVLHTCFDPELPVNIYELGLIYDLIIKPDAQVNILMTLTTPACPVAGSLPAEVERKVKEVPGVAVAKVDLVWDPPWDKDRMSEAAKLQLGIDDW